MHSTDPYTASFSPDAEADRFYREKVRAAVETILSSWIGDAPAIVLSGSLALGEGRVLRNDGRIQPGSDIDLYLVTGRHAHANANETLPRLHASLAKHEETRGLAIDLGITTPERLAAAPVSIANRTLAEFGRVLSGDRAVLDAMRAITGRPIPAADGRLLLENRTVESLVPVPQFGEVSMHDAFWYLHAKTVRDIGLSAIVVAGRFAPRLGDRTRLVRETWATTALGAMLPEFPERYEMAARGESLAGDEAALRSAWMELGATLYAVAGWVHRALGAPAGEDAAAWVRPGGEKLRRRVRSWLPLAQTEPGAFLRAMSRGFPGTPMQGAYVAAACLMASTGLAWGSAPKNADKMLASARAVYPFPAAASDPESLWWELRNGVCAYWNETVLGGSRTIEKGSPR